VIEAAEGGLDEAVKVRLDHWLAVSTGVGLPCERLYEGETKTIDALTPGDFPAARPWNATEPGFDVK